MKRLMLQRAVGFLLGVLGVVFFLHFTAFGLEANFLANRATAAWLEWSLHLLRIPAARDVTTVYSPTYAMTIIPVCNGLVPLVIVIAGTLAYPASARRKLIGVPGVTIFILLLNHVRILTTFLVGTTSGEAADVIHEVWNILAVVVCFFAWMWWTRWVGRSQHPSGVRCNLPGSVTG